MLEKRWGQLSNEIKEKKEFIVAAQDQGAQMGTAQRA